MSNRRQRKAIKVCPSRFAFGSNCAKCAASSSMQGLRDKSLSRFVKDLDLMKRRKSN